MTLNESGLNAMRVGQFKLWWGIKMMERSLGVARSFKQEKVEGLGPNTL
jgi:hypothetical protein